MKAVRCKDHKACLAHVPAPAGEGVRVRIAAAGICGSDLHMIAMGFPLPFTLGHEISGVTDNGTAVAVEPIAACGHCACCQRGEYNLCTLGSQTVLGVGQDGSRPGRCACWRATTGRKRPASAWAPRCSRQANTIW